MIFKYTLPHIFIKVFITHLLLLLSVSLYAQREITIVKEYLQANAKTWGLTVNDLQEMKVSSAYSSPSTGWFHIYFNQYYQSIPVYNGVLNVTVKDEQVIHINNSFIPNTNASILNNFKETSLTPKMALQKVAAQLNLTASESSKVKEVTASQLLNGATNKVILLDRQLSTDSIHVSLCWLPTKSTQNEKNKTILTLAWNVVLTPKDKKNLWSVHLDANSGTILHQTDAIIHCDFGKPRHSDNAFSIEVIHNPSFINTLLSNSYHVFDLPTESPNHGLRTLVTQPYTRFSPLGMGPSTTNGWHNDGINNYTITRGNNVWVQEDTNGNNGIGASPSSTILSFDYPYSQGLNTAPSNLNAVMTNVFYWNNVIHDILWKYGFDEPSGNFQQANLNRGGVGNDFIFADVQDGEGTNNANFYSPVDGYNGRMQVYLWSDAGSPSYQPDGGFDNGIITHEYAHGWSTRLTGGPANSSCLTNAEQAGEGWSDYLALMLTTNWANLTPSLASANIPRTMGTYVLGQANTGSGIRPYPYSYDKVGVNNEVTYAKVGDTNFSIPHGVGSIWATILWDMTWEIILHDKKIVSDIYNTSELVGNIAALKLVNEGLRLQPCSPSFIDSRDAILKADLLLFNGRYQCAIGRAFARRGLGQNASTGISSDDRNVVEDFTPISANRLTSAQNLNICSNNAFSYQLRSATPATKFSWSRPMTEGLNNAANSDTTSLIEERLINITTSPVTATYHITQSSDVCNIVQQVQVAVYPQPIPLVTPYNICQNSTIPNGQGFDIIPLTDYIIEDSLTHSSPSYSRGIGNANTTYTPSTSYDGTAVHFKTFSFIASKTEPITIEVTSADFFDSDSYLSLYKDTFDATSPEINFLVGDDDSGINYLSSIQTTLTKGEKYIIVVSSYYNQEVGNFTLKASMPIFNVQTNWYKTATETTPLFTGTPFNPLAVAASGISNTASIDTSVFYVATTAIEGCRSKMQFVVFRPFLTSSSSDALLCYNNTTTLSATCSLGVPQWNNQVGLNGKSLSTHPIVADTSYQVNCEHIGCKGQTKSIRITLRNPVPAVPKDTLVLQGEQLILQTNNCTSNGNRLTWYRYYDNAPITFPQLALDDSSFYYARCTHSNCLNGTLSSKISVRTTTVFESIKTGDWENLSTWNVGLIPRKTHKVIIHSQHSILLNTVGHANHLDCKGQLLLNSLNSKLELSP